MSSRKSWDSAIASVKLDCPDWQPDEEYLELMEQEIRGEITTQDIIEILIKKHKVEV